MTRAHLIWELNIYQIRKNNFLHLGLAVVHQSYPRHLIGRFKRLRNTMPFCCFLDKGFLHFLCLLVNISEVAVQLAAQQQSVIKGWAVFFEIPFVPLTPHADRLFFFSGYGQAGQIVVANQFIPQTVVLVKNALVHIEILRYNIFAHTSQFSDCHTLLYPVV